MRKIKWQGYDWEIYKLIFLGFEEGKIRETLNISKDILTWSLDKFLKKKLIGGREGRYIVLKNFPLEISLGEILLPETEERKLMEKLIEKNQSNEDMALIFQVSPRTIGRKRKKYGLKKKRDRGSLKKRINVYLRIEIYELRLSYKTEIKEVEPSV
ncbi:hypothetical protein [Cetobacterium sp. SF1]|uniref:hypothetical protein n=1 Tax=Cetobacterium sp. SF1 TaxID=3417654 RepID=UPI003CF5A699